MTGNKAVNINLVDDQTNYQIKQLPSQYSNQHHEGKSRRYLNPIMSHQNDQSFEIWFLKGSIKNISDNLTQYPNFY